MKSEPVLTVAGVVSAGTALLSLLVAFGLPFNSNQQAAILGVIAVAAPLVVIFSRRWVTPTADPKVEVDGHTVALVPENTARAS